MGKMIKIYYKTIRQGSMYVCLYQDLPGDTTRVNTGADAWPRSNQLPPQYKAIYCTDLHHHVQ